MTRPKFGFRNFVSSVLTALTAAMLALNPIATWAAPNPAMLKARPVVLTGQPAADVAGASFSSIDGNSPVVNDVGQICFNASIVGDGINSTNNHGVWFFDSDGTGSLVARHGDRPPGLPEGTQFGDWGFEPPQLNNQGSVSIQGGLLPAVQPIETGVWTTAGGDLRLLAADRYPLPNSNGNPIVGRGVWAPRLNNADQTAFFTRFGSGLTLWVDTPGQPLRQVVSRGDHLPGMSTLVTDFGGAMVDRHGRAAFYAIGWNGFQGQSGWWSELTGTLKPVIMTGDVAPEANGRRALSVQIGSTNDDGLAAVDVILEGPASGFRILYAQRADGSLRRVAQTESPISGASVTLSNFYEPLINAHGRVAFPGYLTGVQPGGGGPTSVWVEEASGLKLVAAAGDLAPGASNAHFRNFNRIQFNDRGDVLFEAFLESGVDGVDGDNDMGLWLRSAEGDLSMIAREGEWLDVDPGPGVDLRRTTYVNAVGDYGGVSSQRRRLTNAGQVLFRAAFEDGSAGLFLTQAIPEPTTCLSLISAMAALIQYRRVTAR